MLIFTSLVSDLNRVYNYMVVFFQVIASDVNQDGSFEVLAIDNSGNIACKSLDGKMVSVNLLTFQVKLIP